MRAKLSASQHHALPADPVSSKLLKVAQTLTTESHTCSHAGDSCRERVRGEQSMADPDSGDDNAPVVPFGRRSAPRLRLSLPAQLIAVEKVHTCILLNLSRSGAQVAILDAMREGEGAILRCGVINRFAIITRSEFGLNALQFDEPLTDEAVLDIRRYHENFEERERRALIETARKWVTGDTSDDRPI